MANYRELLHAWNSFPISSNHKSPMIIQKFFSMGLDKRSLHNGRVDPGLSYFDTTTAFKADCIEASGVLQNGCFLDQVFVSSGQKDFLSGLVLTVHEIPPCEYYTALHKHRYSWLAVCTVQRKLPVTGAC